MWRLGEGQTEKLDISDTLDLDCFPLYRGTWKSKGSYLGPMEPKALERETMMRTSSSPYIWRDIEDDLFLSGVIIARACSMKRHSAQD